MNAFLSGFADELVKIADGGRMTRVQAAPTESPHLTSGVPVWQQKVQQQTKRRKLKSLVAKNVAARSPSTQRFSYQPSQALKLKPTTPLPVKTRSDSVSLGQAAKM